MHTEKQIKRFTQRLIKQGESAFTVAKKAETKFNEKFLVVNGTLYRETDNALNVVLSEDYIKARKSKTE